MSISIPTCSLTGATPFALSPLMRRRTPPATALTGEAISPRFEVDNTPPRIEALTAKVEGDKIHVTFHASDTFR